MSKSPDDRRFSGAQWTLDLSLGLGLLLALVVIFALDRTPSVVAPAEIALSPLTQVELPPMPFLALPSEKLDKAPPPLPDAPVLEEPPTVVQEPAIETNEVKPGRVLAFGFTTNNRFGIRAKRDGQRAAKRLTLNEFGRTNHTMIMVGPTPTATMRKSSYFSSAGVIVQDLKTMEEFDAESSAKGEESSQTSKANHLDEGPYITKWDYAGVRVEQRAEVIPGEISRELDTAKITFTLTNLNRFTTRAGVRLMIDTFIGGNDGVPFFVPGREGVIEKPISLEGKDVPQSFFALEENNLTDPNMTVVQVGFGGKENRKPDRLVISQWPGNTRLARLHPTEQWRAVENLPEDWQLDPTFNNDSAIGLFYQPKELKPKESLSFYFTYGLGSLSSEKSRNASLALVPYGPFIPGQTFRLTALVKNPTENQVLRLKLPDGLQWSDQETPEKTLTFQPGANIAKVDWKVAISPGVGGKQSLRVDMVDTAISEVGAIFVENPDPVLHSVTVTGQPVSGGLVRVTAAILKPKAGMEVTLVPPKGVHLESAGSEKQVVSAGKVAQPNWLVRIYDSTVGELKFTVRTTDPASEKSAVATVVPAQTLLGKLQVDGLPQSGGVVRVTVQVLHPKNGQKLTLELPQGLSLANQETAEKSLPAGRVASLSWLVSIDPGRTGNVEVKATLTPGSTSLTQAITIKPAKAILEVLKGGYGAVSPGRPFWVVARAFHSPAGESVTITLPRGMKLFDQHSATKTLEAKTRDGFHYAEAAWPVVLDEYTEPSVTLSVQTKSIGEQELKIACDRGTLIGK